MGMVYNIACLEVNMFVKYMSVFIVGQYSKTELGALFEALLSFEDQVAQKAQKVVRGGKSGRGKGKGGTWQTAWLACLCK